MQFPEHRTKIVCTIGPASDTVEMLEQLIVAGMNVARLNFSHGEFEGHARVIERLRQASANVGQRVAIMADLPGPKIRIGELEREDIHLERGADFVLTTDTIVGNEERVSVAFPVTDVLSPGDRVFINDGIIELEVVEVETPDVRCVVRAGGEMRSRKGLNLPGVDLGISAFTDRDRECLEFVLDHGIDAVSQSFVASAADLQAVRDAAQALGRTPFVIAKIERAQALERIDEILEAADGIMVARGDLGVEIPIEEIAVVQKDLIAKASSYSMPVITATQMLESMVEQKRPTRAEATDVANAILDGTDCVMLSAESAVGRYPVEAVGMLAGIARATEHSDYGTFGPLPGEAERVARGEPSPIDLVSLSVAGTAQLVEPVAVVVPTRSGHTVRNLTRFRLPVWILALSSHVETCNALQFSWGVHTELVDEHLSDWSRRVRDFLHGEGFTTGLALLTQGPSLDNPDSPHRMEVIDLAGPS